MKLRTILQVFAFAALFASCAAPQNITYFQDVQNEQVALDVANPQKIKIMNGDKLSIIVNCRDMQLTRLYNLMEMQTNLSQSVGTGSTGTMRLAAYTVDDNGDIDFPQIGRMHIAGLNRSQVASMVKNKLVESEGLKDATVTVEFLNLYVSVMGEVKSPGRLAITRDEITLLDAISLAGDLTVYGRRENLHVFRTEGNTQKKYDVNLLSAQSLVNSPVYNLQQGDVIYVEPNDYKKRQSTVNGNSMLTPSFWISIASFLSTVGVLIFK